MDAQLSVPVPRNEPVRTYAPGSAERTSLQARVDAMKGERLDLTMTIGGRQSMGDGQFLALARQYGCMGLLATQSVNVLEASSLRDAWR